MLFFIFFKDLKQSTIGDSVIFKESVFHPHTITRLTPILFWMIDLWARSAGCWTECFMPLSIIKTKVSLNSVFLLGVPFYLGFVLDLVIWQVIVEVMSLMTHTE